ncbi:MAG: hypothetical protein WA474_19000 [Candidatus Sulfotelmatobacter sp.]
MIPTLILTLTLILVFDPDSDLNPDPNSDLDASLGGAALPALRFNHSTDRLQPLRYAIGQSAHALK